MPGSSLFAVFASADLRFRNNFAASLSPPPVPRATPLLGGDSIELPALPPPHRKQQRCPDNAESMVPCGCVAVVLPLRLVLEHHRQQRHFAISNGC